LPSTAAAINSGLWIAKADEPPQNPPMATSDQLKALLKAYVSDDRAQFTSVAMQIAANEAKAGHGKLAEELRKLIDESKARVPARAPSPIPLVRPKGEVADLLTVSYPKVRLSDLILSKDTAAVLQRLLKEHRSLRDIRSHG